MSERGSITVLTVFLVAGLVLVAVGLAGVGRLMAAHLQATVAADAAALAAAPLTFLGGDATAEAGAYASANGARLVSCRCPSDPRPVARVVTVEVVSQVELPFFGPLRVRGRAAAEFDPAGMLGG